MVYAFFDYYFSGRVPPRTEILGQSQTQQWFVPGGFNLPGWQARIRTGSGFDEWSDPNDPIWRAQPVPTPSSTVVPYTDIERVVVTVGPLQLIRRPPPTQPQFQQMLRDMVTTVRAKYPRVRQIFLQPLAGGPGGAICEVGGQPVRSAAGLAFVVEAITAVVGGDVATGLIPEVANCSQFADAVGHLTAAGRRHVAALMEQHYGGR